MKKIVKSSLEIYASNILVLGINAIITLFLVSYLPKEIFASWVYGITLFNILVVTSLFGFQKAIHHQIPRLRIRKNSEHLREFIGLCRLAVLATGIIFTSIVCVWHLWRPLAIQDATVVLFSFMIAVPFWSHIRIRAEILRSYGATFAAILPDDGIKIATYGVLPLICIIWGLAAPNTVGLFAPLIVSAFIAFVICKKMDRVYKVIPSKKSPPDVRILKKWLLFCLPFWLISVLQILLQRIDLLILGQIGVFETLALYGLILKLVQTISFPAAAIATALAPDFSHMDELQDTKLKRVIAFSSISAFVIGLIGSFFLYFLAPYIFELIRDDYELDKNLLLTLLAAEVLLCVYLPLFTATIMTGSKRFALISLLFGVVAIVSGNLVLIGDMGYMGTAITRLATFAVLIVVLAVHMMFTKIHTNASKKKAE